MADEEERLTKADPPTEPEQPRMADKGPEQEATPIIDVSWVRTTLRFMRRPRWRR
jgi:hypothetical protein